MTPEEAELWPGGSVLFHHPPCLASGRFSHCGKQQRSQMLTRTRSPGVSPSLRQPLTQAPLCLALGVSSPQRRARDTVPFPACVPEVRVVITLTLLQTLISSTVLPLFLLESQRGQ